MSSHLSPDDLPIVRDLGHDLQRAFRASEDAATAHGRSRSFSGRLSSWSVQGRHRVASTIAVAVSVCVVAAIIFAATAGHGIQTTAHPARSQAHPSAPAALAAQRALTRVLAVMRRPQGAAERRAAMTLARRPPTLRRAIASSMRLIRLPDHGYILLYLARPKTRVGAGSAALPILGFSERGRDNGIGACCLSVRDLEQPSGPENGSFYESATGQRISYFEIVPDGVATVRWTYPRHPNYALSIATNRTFSPLTVSVPVHDNVAVVELGDRGTPTRVVWLATDGAVIASARPRP